jgi:TonB family protein
MQLRRLVLAILVFAAVSRLASSQEPLPVDKDTLDQHVGHRVPPVYPPIAKAARIQGTVVFDVKIGLSGKVESMKVVSGPAMLQQAAIDCVKQWSYRPFEKDGASVPATGQISIEFSLGKDGPTPGEEKIAQRYFPAFDECRKALSGRTDRQAAAALCKEAAEIADGFASDVRFIERRSAFVYAASALASNGELKDAQNWAEKAVEVVKQGHDDNGGNNAAYSTRGTIEGMSGNLVAADRDLTIAEDFGRKGISWAEKEAPGLSQEYKRPFARDLRFHAKVLQALNRPDESQKKLDEAAAVD